jgi:hypothetical protein
MTVLANHQRPNHSLVKRIIRSKKIILGIGAIATAMFMESQQKRLSPTPYHTSTLSGQQWMTDLETGHPLRIQEQLGMNALGFRRLVKELVTTGALRSGRRIAVNEMVGIFLYTVRTNQSIRQVAERFQRSNDTIHRYFHRVLQAILSDNFQSHFLHLPDPSHISPMIIGNPKLYPFFKDALGAIDGTLVRVYPPEEDVARHRDRKGGITQNVLACCTFDMRFCYVLSGWEGSISDSALFEEARARGLAVPEGKYYLADAGFAGCDALLVPYRGVRYHLREWASANLR